jgi:hypothetical protein
MNSELLPATKDESRKVTVRLSRDQLALLDRFCTKNEVAPAAKSCVTP